MTKAKKPKAVSHIKVRVCPPRARGKGLRGAGEPETFVTREMQGGGVGRGYTVAKEYEPTPVLTTAIKRGDAACKAGKYVLVESNYTSNGWYWKGHKGRTAASCQNKRWVVG